MPKRLGRQKSKIKEKQKNKKDKKPERPEKLNGKRPKHSGRQREK